MTIDNGYTSPSSTSHVAGHFSLPPDTERNLKVIVETALTELAESVVQGMIDKQFNEIVDKVLTDTIENRFGDLVKYISEHFTISPEGERNITLVMETAIIRLAHTSVERIVDERFDSLFRNVMTDALNNRVKYAMSKSVDTLDIQVSNLAEVEKKIEPTPPPAETNDIPLPLVQQLYGK